MKNLFSLFIVMIAFFALCSCSPKNNTEELVDPSSKVNWHGAPFDKCNEYGELLGVEKEVHGFGEFYKNAEDYDSEDYAIVSASPDGGFFYALKCYKGVGWCLRIYKRIAEEEKEWDSYKFLNGCYYNLQDKPAASYQLTIRPSNGVDAFACTGTDGKVHISTPIEIIKAVNIIEGSDFPKEETSLKGFFYYVACRSEVVVGDRDYFATHVFSYRAKDSIFLDPKYIYNQIQEYGFDSFDSSIEGWDKNTLSSLIGYFANGIYYISWYDDAGGLFGDYKPWRKLR